MPSNAKDSFCGDREVFILTHWNSFIHKRRMQKRRRLRRLENPHPSTTVTTDQDDRS